MHISVLLALWAFISFILHKILVSVITSRRHAAAARKLGCQPAYRAQGFDPLGIVGILELIKADKEFRILQYIKGQIDDACAKEGKVVSTFSDDLMGSVVHFTTEPRNIHAVLATQFSDFGLGETRNAIFAPLLGRGIFSSDGKDWKHARALLRPQFARDQISDLQLEETHVQNMMRVMPVQKDGWTAITDVKQLFFRLTIDSATEFLFGESVDSQLASLPDYVSSRAPMAVNEQGFAASFDKAQSTIARGFRFGDGYWLVYNKAFRDHCSRCHAFIDHYVQLALSKEKNPAQKTSVFLDGLVESTHDPIEIRSQMISVLIAGRDSTASLLSYIFMLFTQHPDVYAKLRDVVLEEFGTYRAPKNLAFSKLKGCNYLQWILNETLRLYPIVPIDGRRALCDTTIPTGGGPDGTSPVYVRKGQQVDYCVYIMHRRKDLWGPDADEFKPERWNGRKTGWQYLPFNGGPRICIGQQFALTEAGYVIVRLAQRFEKIEGVGNMWEEESRGGIGYVRHAYNLTTCPADPVKVKMKEAAE